MDRHGATYQRLIRQMGADGWMGVGWPKEYGGHGLGEVEQTIFANEAQYADVHLPAVTLQTVGPTLIRYGTEKQKELFLPRILAGDVHFAIGYSEPDAGTDLASLRTSARRDGDHYVVNGQKMWTTGGHQADYLWLAVRTDPDAPKHKGISILIVDTRDPGYSLDADHHRRRLAPRQRDLLQRRPGAGRHAGRRGEPGLEADHHPAQPRAGHARPGRPDRGAPRPGRRLGHQGRRARRARTCATLLGQVTAVFRVNELLNWEVARAAARRRDLGRRRVVVQGVRLRPGAAPARRPDRASCTATATRPTTETRELLRLPGRARPSATWCSPSAAACRRCSAS